LQGFFFWFPLREFRGIPSGIIKGGKAVFVGFAPLQQKNIKKRVYKTSLRSALFFSTSFVFVGTPQTLSRLFFVAVALRLPQSALLSPPKPKTVTPCGRGPVFWGCSVP